MELDTVFRVMFLLVFLTSVGISGFYRRRARQSGDVIPRRAEGSLALILRMVMALIVAVSFFAYVFAPSWLSWSNWHLPLWVRFLGTIIAMLCIPAIRWMFVSIGNNISETVLTKKAHQLVMAGPYRWIRHPLYAFALLELFALALVASSWFLFIFPCIATIVFRLFVIPREEANLIKFFGKRYEVYIQHTGALFPLIKI
jgi:protein-S-isoprenylcysteine O-methyltransferase Ste14